MYYTFIPNMFCFLFCLEPRRSKDQHEHSVHCRRTLPRHDTLRLHLIHHAASGDEPNDALNRPQQNWRIDRFPRCHTKTSCWLVPLIGRLLSIFYSDVSNKSSSALLQRC